MPEIQEIDVLVQRDGTLRIEVRGVKGPACADITRSIVEQLGGHVLEHVPTDESSEWSQEQAQTDRAKLHER